MTSDYPNFVRLARGLDRLLGWFFSLALAGLVMAALAAAALAVWAISHAITGGS